MKIQLNWGCTWDPAQLDAIERLNKQYPSTLITEVYGSVKGYMTARSQDRVQAVDVDSMKKYIERAASLRVDVKWTLNVSCFGAMEQFDWANTSALILKLREMGIHKFIVALPLLVSLTQSVLGSDAEIEVSTISRIASTSEMSRYIKLGATGMCWDVMENRNFPLLSRCMEIAKDCKFSIEMIANEFCTYRCVYRNHCYNLSSHNSGRNKFGHYPFGWCAQERAEEPWQWVMARFILPEWLDLYAEKGVTKFKITGRTQPTEVSLPIVEAYMRRESPANLLDLWPHVDDLSGMRRPDIFIPTSRVKNMNLEYQFTDCENRCKGRCNVCEVLYFRWIREHEEGV